MYELLKTIDTFVWLADALVFAVFFVYLVKEIKLSSSLIALAVVVMLDGISLHYIVMLESIKDPAYIWLERIAWYAGLSILHMITIYSVYKLHYISKTPYSFITKMVFLEYSTYTIMHIIRYTERTVFKTEFLKALYKNGILSISLSTTVVTIGFAILVMVSKHRMSKGKKTLLWKI